MNVKLIRSYRSKNGNVTFVYAVSGSTQQVETYKEAQGEFYREDDAGTPLWFTTRCIGDNGKLLITTNGNIVPDMSEFDKAASIAQQYGGNFGTELAKASAAKILGGAPTEAPAAPTQPTSVSAEESTDIEQM